ncbi:MAG: HEPN domain-containing protein [Candidatus Cloacimonetes bacterium]|nr:HEPN domain-containing protein [Candidatus Cloacimonadota bacterium]
MRKKLKILEKQNRIKSLRPDFKQINRWLVKAKKDLKTAEENLNIDVSWAFTIAYQAMLLAGRALMFAHGVLPAASGQHRTTIETSREILGADFIRLIEQFDRMRRLRHEFLYGARIETSSIEAKEAIKTASEFLRRIEKIIEKENPQKKLL